MKNVVLVTGAGRGIGRATARLLARKGYAVCVNYRSDTASAEQLVEDIRVAGGEAVAVQADVSEQDQVSQLFQHIDRQLGRLTHLVNNAGVLLPQSRLVDMSEERINTLLKTNVTSSFLCSKAAISRMPEGGAIVNVSSAASRTGSPFEYIDYAASKGAIDTLTTGLAIELAGQGIRVNCVRPGFIYTDMHKDGGEPGRVDRLKSQIPLQRGGTPEEVAQAIAFLLSDEASYITGSFIDIAGGR